MKRYSTMIALAIVLFCYSNSFAQPSGHELQLDDGLGHYTILKGSSSGGGTLTLPTPPGTVMTASAGVSPVWLVGGNNTPSPNTIGTITGNNFSLIAGGATPRATFSAAPSSSTPMLTLTNTSANIQGVRINGSLDAVVGNTLAGNPGVWDVVVDGDKVVTGIFKSGSGSLWFDGNSPTHGITSNKPLNITTTTNDSIMFSTNGTTRMTVGRNGTVGIGTMNPSSLFQVTGTPPDPAIVNPANFYTPDPFNHVLTVENMASNAKGNGIAIIIHNPVGILVPDQPTSDGHYNNNESNYMTYYNDNGDHNHIKGRIEGFSYENYERLKQQIDAIQSNTDIYNPFSYFTFNVTYNSSWFQYNSGFINFTPPTLPTFSFGSLPSLDYCDIGIGFDVPCGLSGGSFPSLSGGSLGSLSFSSPFTVSSPLTNLTNPFSINYAFINGIVDQFVALPYKEKAAMIATNKIQAAINFSLSFLGGVTYESGSGDYAEWLERADHNEKINIGDVVGVIGDKITKNTDGANHFMVASWKPCVLGNMPEAGKEQFYHKVAFMGQIPVKMACPVKKGDFIVPDGTNNGFAKAISPNDITADNMDKVFGVAWDDAPDAGVKFVKIAVGLKPQEMVKVIQDEAKEIATLENKLSKIDAVKAKLATLKSQIASSQMAKYSKKKSKHTKQLSSN